MTHPCLIGKDLNPLKHYRTNSRLRLHPDACVKFNDLISRTYCAHAWSQDCVTENARHAFADIKYE